MSRTKRPGGTNAAAWFYAQPGFHALPTPEIHEVINHKNGDPRDNRVSNLERIEYDNRDFDIIDPDDPDGAVDMEENGR